MKIKLVEPLKDEDGRFQRYMIPKEQKVKSYDSKGDEVYLVKPIPESSKKYHVLNEILRQSPCKEFITLGERLKYFISKTKYPTLFTETASEDLYIMTDFSDPRPLIGLCFVEDEEQVESVLKDHSSEDEVENYKKINAKENLLFIALATDWEYLNDGSLAGIFGHEYSHLWFLLLNFPSDRQTSNKFHCSTGITDPYTAFNEGFAEHLEIVSLDLAPELKESELHQDFWDNGMNINAWLSYRDKQLRYHAVKNNRYVYRTATPDLDEYPSYIDLHMAHITSSAFLPEKVKNGSQILASEGAMASVFYQIYNHPTFQNRYLPEEFYQQFGVSKEVVNPVENLYLKIFYALAQPNPTDRFPMIHFVESYGECFPEEKEELFTLFLEMTHYTTVSHEAAALFGENYRRGRRGLIEPYKDILQLVIDFKKEVTQQVINGERPLDGALYPPLWVKNPDCVITPVPWVLDYHVEYELDLNTATVIDYLSFEGIDLEMGKKIVQDRTERKGFANFEEFKKLYPDINFQALS